MNDILSFTHKIQSYVGSMSREEFENSGMTYDAVVRNVELIGEASKKIPLEVCSELSEIPWREMIGMRNYLIHGYFGINNDILWNVISVEIPKISALIDEYLKRSNPS
jgi:uncharacterized protein with HEPN domain